MQQRRRAAAGRARGTGRRSTTTRYGERGQEERAPDDRRDARALRRQPRPRARADGLGHPQRADERDREQREQHDVREHARRRAQLDRGAEETSMPRPMPPALTTPLVRPTAAGSRRGCRSSSAALGGAEREAGGEALECRARRTASDRVGEHEQDASSPSARRARPAAPAGGRPRRKRGRRGAGSRARRTRTSRRSASGRAARSPRARGRCRRAATACRTRTARARSPPRRAHRRARRERRRRSVAGAEGVSVVAMAPSIFPKIMEL